MTTVNSDKPSRLHYYLLNTSPAWYAAVMGIGITANLLYEFPYSSHWLKVVGIIFFACAIGLFAVTTLLLTMRLLYFPTQFKAMVNHIGQSSFIGCAPMGFATIINMTHYIWGDRAWKACFAMWWIDVAMSLLSAWLLVFYMLAYQDRSKIASLNATILLPVVALVVAGATGGLICNSLPVHLQKLTAVVSFMLWGNGEAVGFAFTVIYMYRMLAGQLPPNTIMISNFLPVGPLGQGAFAIMNFCELDIFSEHTEIMELLGTIMALAMIGYASFWIFIAVCAIVTHPPKVFHMSFWGLTFPLGTYVSACYKLGEALLPAFKPVGCAFCVIVVMCVLGCTFCSIYYIGALLEQVSGETAGEELEKFIHCDSSDDDSTMA